MCTRSLSPEKSGQAVALTTRPCIAPRLKKEYGQISTPLWDFLACSTAPLKIPHKMTARENIKELTLKYRGTYTEISRNLH